MQVTSLLSRQEHEHAHDDSCGACGHEDAPVRLWQTLIGVVFVVNAFIVDWFFQQGHSVASASALIGAIILGYPIVLTAVRDLREGILSINELVAIAVLAAVASGDYKTAGVVAFFMLMGEIIETRTAEGARASIESLIKLTPTKARRLKADKSEEEVAASQLAVGDVIRIRPGDNVAADGVIVNGQGSFNQATIPVNRCRWTKRRVMKSSREPRTLPACSKSKSVALDRILPSVVFVNSFSPLRRPSSRS